MKFSPHEDFSPAAQAQSSEPKPDSDYQGGKTKGTTTNHISKTPKTYKNKIK